MPLKPLDRCDSPRQRVHRRPRADARFEHSRASCRCRGDERERQARVTTTDENGAYRFEGLTEGEWLVTASKGGYVTWQFGQRRPFQTPPPISLTRGERFTADIPLTRGGAISGRVYDASGDALAGLQVRVYRATMEQGTRRLKAVGVADMTDDTGAYRVYGLPPGDYYVAASLRVAPRSIRSSRRPTRRRTFRAPADLSEAQRIKLGLGGEAQPRSRCCRFASTRISGVVLNGAGAPADAFLNLVSEGSELGVPDRRRWRDAIRRNVHACRRLARALHPEGHAAW